jgi:hypothetical protein
VVGDSAYGTGDLRHHLPDRDRCAVIKPPPLQPAVEGGYTLDDFAIDEPAAPSPAPPE